MLLEKILFESGKTLYLQSLFADLPLKIKKSPLSVLLHTMVQPAHPEIS